MAKPMKRKEAGNESSGSSMPARIDARIEELADWRGSTLARLRALLRQADPEVVEDWKWVKPTSPGVPVWSHDGLICTGEVYKDKVKMTFAKGASLADPSGLFNASLEGNVRRAIDFHEGDRIDEKALMALIGAAVAFNASKVRGAARKPAAGTAPLSGGPRRRARVDGKSRCGYTPAVQGSTVEGNRR